MAEAPDRRRRVRVAAVADLHLGDSDSATRVAEELAGAADEADVLSSRAI